MTNPSADTKAARFRFACEWRTDGTPVAQPRVRAVARGKHASVYDPGTANAWKEAIVAAGERHRPAAPLQGPLRVVLRFYFPRPKRLLRKKDPIDRIAHTAKPDTDNLVKAVLDCLTGADWWGDDAQVCDVHATKWYCNKGGTPGLIAFITQVEQPPEEGYP